ncbi:Conserved_hypothetical protein [Hexamita inflata]|uniref:Uncharacterized protein n=1 Tax=Hexamita inflata TaxID=28002 RepID=A0AA86N6I6_9EUKA|nr:Conserved hypothetical protein [Hexamita inflata]CAI9933676.1 Conserved hypothetical protein [Hexamita inflata]CAI9963381.1 Conserved hypothetical protein [Hexamita inflata]
MKLSQEIEQVFTKELNDSLRVLLMNRTQEMISNQELANFRSCQLSDSPKIVPVCLYDVARRLPLTSNDPMFQVGEYFSMLLTIKQNYMQVMGTQTANNMQLVQKFEDVINQLLREASNQILGHDIDINLSQSITASLMRAFPPTKPQFKPQTQTPTQQDIKNLEEMLFQIPNHHGRALVFGTFLREIGYTSDAVVLNGNQFDLDFTTMPAQQFWVLYEVARRFAPGVK